MKINLNKTKMKFQFRNREHTVVFIDYYKGRPSNVVTTVHIPNADDGPYDRKVHWDFDPNIDWGGDLMYYESGSGGSIEDGIECHNAVKPKHHSYWSADGINIKGGNYSRSESPIKLEGYGRESCNPFDVAEEVSDRTRCNKCKGMIGESICTKHMYDDDNGDMRWRGNHKLVNQ